MGAPGQDASWPAAVRMPWGCSWPAPMASATMPYGWPAPGVLASAGTPAGQRHSGTFSVYRTLWRRERQLLCAAGGGRGGPRRGARGRADAGGLGEPPVVGGAAALAAAPAARVPLCGEWRSRPVRGVHAVVAQETKAGPLKGRGGASVGTDEGGGARARGKRRGRGPQEESESARHGRRGPETRERLRQGGTGDRCLQNKRSPRAPCVVRRSCSARGSMVRVPPPHPPPAPPMSMLAPKGPRTLAK